MRGFGIGTIGSVMLVGACQRGPTLPSPHAGLRVMSSTLAHQYGRHTEHVDLPFRLVENGTNGTGLLLTFLQRLQSRGAVYVSDLSYALQVTYGGVNVECVSKIVIRDGSPAAPATPPAAAPPAAAPPVPDDGDVEYATTVKPWRPGEADAWVVDRDMICKTHAQQVMTTVPQYDNRYDGEVRRMIGLGEMPADDTAIVHYEACTYEPKRRFVHRYDHFVAARFSPPDLRVIQARYSDWPLVEEPPLCHEIRLAPGQALRQRIEADVHFETPIAPGVETDINAPVPVPWRGE